MNEVIYSVFNYIAFLPKYSDMNLEMDFVLKLWVMEKRVF
jgi:hypothetical protein